MTCCELTLGFKPSQVPISAEITNNIGISSKLIKVATSSSLE